MHSRSNTLCEKRRLLVILLDIFVIFDEDNFMTILKNSTNSIQHDIMNVIDFANIKKLAIAYALINNL